MTPVLAQLVAMKRNEHPGRRSMAFSLDRFYRLNRRAVIWLAFLALLWLLRDFFALIFLTFVLAFLSASLVKRLEALSGLPYWLRLVMVYVLLLGALAAFVGLVAPTAVRETARFVGSLDELKTTLVRLQSEFVVA
jgi:predicted PurR-regulated permease PerM